MADIKTRDTSKGTIKTINKAAVATERMKKAYVMTKDKAEHSTNASENSAEEYASDKIEAATDRTVHGTAYRADKVGRWGVRETRQNYQKAKFIVRDISRGEIICTKIQKLIRFIRFLSGRRFGSSGLRHPSHMNQLLHIDLFIITFIKIVKLL